MNIKTLYNGSLAIFITSLIVRVIFFLYALAIGAFSEYNSIIYPYLRMISEIALIVCLYAIVYQEVKKHSDC